MLTIPVQLTVTSTPVPDIWVSPQSISKTLQAGGSGAELLTVGNDGTASLGWTGQVDKSWLNLAPTSGSVSAGQSSSVSVNFTAPSTPGSYSATVTISSNDPDENPTFVLVSLKVLPAPTYQASGYVKDSGAQGFSGVLMSFSGGLASVYSDASGFWVRSEIPTVHIPSRPARLAFPLPRQAVNSPSAVELQVCQILLARRQPTLPQAT